METIVITVSLIFPAIVMVILFLIARRVNKDRTLERINFEKKEKVMKQVIEKKNEIISRMSEIIES